VTLTSVHATSHEIPYAYTVVLVDNFIPALADKRLHEHNDWCTVAFVGKQGLEHLVEMARRSHSYGGCMH
jgi:hypothetical protein